MYQVHRMVHGPLQLCKPRGKRKAFCIDIIKHLVGGTVFVFIYLKPDLSCIVAPNLLAAVLVFSVCLGNAGMVQLGVGNFSTYYHPFSERAVMNTDRDQFSSNDRSLLLVTVPLFLQTRIGVCCTNTQERLKYERVETWESFESFLGSTACGAPWGCLLKCCEVSKILLRNLSSSSSQPHILLPFLTWVLYQSLCVSLSWSVCFDSQFLLSSF